MKNKQGVTLVVLVITIIIMLILVGTLSVSVGNSVGNSRISTFASDLSEIVDMTKTYYMLNNKIPSLDDKVYNQGEILEIVPARYKSKFIEELQMNNDDTINDTDGTFYMIDLSKIDIEQSTRGTRIDEDGNSVESDVFIVSYPSFNVYYLAGLKANNDIFFSLSSKITQLTKIEKNETVEKGKTSLTTSNGIIIKKEDDSWINKLNITIESNMDENEKLYIQIGESEKCLITTVIGKNVLILKDNFSSIYSNTTSQEIPSGIKSEDIEIFNNLPQEDKKLIVTKEKDGSVIGKAIIGLENYENDLPEVISNVNVGYEPTYNYIYFNVEDKTSGIGQVRYEYLTRIDDEGNSVTYFDNVEEYDENYMKSIAKKVAVSSNGLVEIKVPKDIESVQINIFDKAGNTSGKINQNIISDIYVGINETEVTTTSLRINALAKIPDGKNINNAVIQISSDGINYINEQNIEFTSSSNNIYAATIGYEDLENISKKVYVKIKLNYGENEEYIRIKEIDVDTIKI